MQVTYLIRILDHWPRSLQARLSGRFSSGWGTRIGGGRVGNAWGRLRRLHPSHRAVHLGFRPELALPKSLKFHVIQEKYADQPLREDFALPFRYVPATPLHFKVRRLCPLPPENTARRLIVPQAPRRNLPENRRAYHPANRYASHLTISHLLQTCVERCSTFSEEAVPLSHARHCLAERHWRTRRQKWDCWENSRFRSRSGTPRGCPARKGGELQIDVPTKAKITCALTATPPTTMKRTLALLSAWTMASKLASFIVGGCIRRGSNPQPLASEANALSS